MDDDPHLREAMARILEHEGHTVLQAPDGPTAVRLTKEHSPDLLVLDGTMPGMDGAMVLGALRSELANETPPAVLLTAGSAQQARTKRMTRVIGLEKPFGVPDLLQAVESGHLQAVESGQRSE